MGNARIESTMLGIEDQGILTCYLHLRQEGAGQGFGGYSLKSHGIDMIKRILETVGVSDWEDLPGEYVRVEGNDHKIRKIGHITDDKWYEPEAEYKEGEKSNDR